MPIYNPTRPAGYSIETLTLLPSPPVRLYRAVYGLRRGTVSLPEPGRSEADGALHQPEIGLRQLPQLRLRRQPG